MSSKVRRQGPKGDRQRIVAIMNKTCGHAYLATVDGKQPWVRSISAIVGKDLSIWIATFAESRKVKHVKRNPRICLEFVTQPDGDQAAVVFGQAKIIRALIEKRKAWRLARYNLTQYFPDGPTSKNYCLLRIVPQRIEWRTDWTGKMKVWK